MMKSIKYISLLTCVAACLAAASCQKDSQTTANTNGSGNQTFIPLDQLNGHNVNPLGDSFHVSFTSAVAWKAEISWSGSSNWLSLNKTNAGSGTTDIEFTAQPWFDSDKKGEERKATIKFKNQSNELLNSVTLCQRAGYLRVLNSDGSEVNECSFIWKADSQKLLVESNVEWEVNFTDRLGNIIADGDMPSFTKDILNGVNNGKPGESSEVTVNLSTNAHNFDTDYNEAHLVFTPVKVDLNAREESKRDYARDISVSQDYLIFVVVEGEGSNLSLDYIPEDAFRRDLVLDGFSELGKDFVETGVVSGYEHITTKYFTLIYEESTVNYNEIPSTDSLGVNVYDVDSRSWNGRDVRCVTFSTTLPKANPECEVKEFEIPLTIEGMEDEEGASRKVTLVQNPYVWDMSVGKLLADDNASTMIIINTTGPWTMEVPEFSSWWNTENTEWSGVGSKIITFTSSEWNLDLTEDKTAAFRISNTCNSLADDLTLIKEHYHFNIGENLVTERETAREVLAELRKKDTDSYAVEVDCSGQWKAEFDDLPAWVNISNLGNGIANSGNNTFTLGALSKNTEEYDRGAKIIFTSLTHQDGTVTDTLYMTQLKHVFGWEPDQWTEETRNQYCNQPAYIVGSGTHTFGFETTFSDTWSLTSNQDWVKFHLGSNSAGKTTWLSGEGDSNDERYVYVTVDNNFNTGSSNRTATVTVYDEFKGVSKSFTISQEPFVFNVTGSSQSIGPLEEKDMPFNVNITEGAPWRVAVTGNTALIASGFQQNWTGTGNAQTLTLRSQKVSKVNESRKATVTISVDGSSLNKSFTVNQSEYRFKTDKQSLSQFAELNPASQTFTVTSDGSYEVEKPDWITLQRSGNTYTATPTNNTGSFRGGNIRIRLTDPAMTSAPIDLQVSQRDFVFSVNATSVSAGVLSNLNHSVTVSSSGKWTASSNNTDVVPLTSASGNGNRNGETLKIDVTKNYSASERNAMITITSEDTGNTKTISVSQPRYEFSVSGAQTQSVGSGASTFTRTVTCSDPAKWDVTSSDVTNFSVKKSSDNKSFTVTILSNEGDGKKETAERSATITVKTTDESKREFKIEVKQAGFKPKTN